MRSKLLLACVAVVALCVILEAQNPRDLELGKQLIARSLEIQNVPDRLVTRFNPHEPFKVLGNLYFVGVSNAAVFLLTSPQGHILFNTAYPGTMPSVEKNIESLGFKTTDIKVILISSWHFNHTGGASYFKEKSGALLAAGAGDIPIIERGGDGNPGAPPRADQPARVLPAGAGGFAENKFPPVTVDRALFDGEVVKVGPLSVTGYNIPGHSPGSMAFLFTVREGNKDYKVFIQSPTLVDTANFRPTPGQSKAAMRHSFETLNKLQPVDVYLATYGYGFWIEDRLAKLKGGNAMAFVDPTLFPAMTAARQEQFEQEYLASKVQSKN